MPSKLSNLIHIKSRQKDFFTLFCLDQQRVILKSQRRISGRLAIILWFVEYLDWIKVQQLALEYATERAGDLLNFQGKELGLGVVNPRTEKVESPEEIKQSILWLWDFFQPPGKQL